MSRGRTHRLQWSRRPGFTLVELVVVLAVLGVLAGVVTVAGDGPATAQADTWGATLSGARARALATGRRVHVYVAPPVRPAGPAPFGDVLALPDGRVLTDRGVIGADDGHRPIDSLTGASEIERSEERR